MDWRHAGSGRGNTARLIIRCPHNDDDTERTATDPTIARMMAGYDSNNEANRFWPPDRHLGIRPFRDSIARLYIEGYFNSPGIAPIIPRIQLVPNAHSELTPRNGPHNQFVDPRTQPQSVSPPDIWIRPCK